MRTILFVCLVPILLFAQEYYEASGQTSIFTLKAGGKAQIASTGKSLKFFNFKRTFTVTGNILRTTPGKCGILKLFMLDGRVVDVYQVNSSGIITLKRLLKNGVYLLQFESVGSPVEISKLVVAERVIK
jgi:hypothetical protein